MKIVRLEITGFGPLAQTSFDFVDELNVIYGPNESAKTAIHAALFSALCGIRRGKGQPTREDKVFQERHKPWNGDPWEVATVVTLAGGRRITLRHDLAGKVGSMAVDASTGKDVSTEIISDGSIDGSIWLGLNRRSFRTTACIRQTEILTALANDADHAQDHGALQEALQKAATSAGQQDKSVSAALKALGDFWSEAVGNKTHGNSRNRPFQSLKRQVVERQRALDQARQAHDGYLELLVQRDAAMAEREAAARAVTLAEAIVHQAEATRLERRAARAAELQENYPEQPLGASGDEALATQVSSALVLWGAAPPEQSLAGEATDQLAARLEELPERPSGELTPAQAVLTASSQLEIARGLQEQHVDQPDESKPPVPAPEVRADHSWARARIPMIAVGLFALAGISAVALGAAAVGAVLLVGAVAAAAATFWFLRPPPAQSPEALAASRSAGSAASRRQRAEELAERVTAAERALTETLDEHGVRLLEGESLEAAVERYKGDCAAREEQDRASRQRERLTLELEQRRHAEEQLTTRSAANEALRAAAAAVGLPETEPEVTAAALRAWHGQHQSGLVDADETAGDWAELQQLLDNQPVETLVESAKRARETADEKMQGFTAEELSSFGAADAASRLPQLRRAHQDALEAAARHEQVAATEDKTLKSVAEVFAELDEAEQSFARVEELDATLQATMTFLQAAQERVYATIAPALAAAVRQWLPGVVVAMDGSGPEPRYSDVRIDPETLRVEVRAADGSPWRDADLLSAGTREQVYLLLRVALAEHLVKQGEVAPLLLDEVTAQADSTRRGALLELILELSKTRQIILFTHDDAVAAWATQRLEEGGLQRLQPVGTA